MSLKLNPVATIVQAIARHKAIAGTILSRIVILSLEVKLVKITLPSR